MKTMNLKPTALAVSCTTAGARARRPCSKRRRVIQGIVLGRDHASLLEPRTKFLGRLWQSKCYDEKKNHSVYDAQFLPDG